MMSEYDHETEIDRLDRMNTCLEADVKYLAERSAQWQEQAEIAETRVKRLERLHIAIKELDQYWSFGLQEDQSEPLKAAEQELREALAALEGQS